MSFAYNSTGVNMDTGPKPFPEGFYKLQIESASDTKDGAPRVTKNGDPYVSLKLKVVSGEYAGRTIFHVATFMQDKSRDGAGIALHLLKTIGEPWEGDFVVEPENWVGKIFEAKIKIGKDMNGMPRNQIAFIPDQETKPADEVPF